MAIRARVDPDVLWLVAAWAAACLLVDPRADVPLIDDWTYAYSVERLLDGRGFAVSPWSSTFPVAQILWGASFAAAGGFSFTTLRISTAVLALVATLAMRGLLLDLGCARARALLGAGTLFLYPVAFVLGFTFMTDVALLASSLLSLRLIVRGLATARAAPLVGGLTMALVAFLVRPVAIALPVGMLAAVIGHHDRGLTRRGALLAIATLAAMLAGTVVAGRLWPYAGEGGVAYRVERLWYVFLVPPAVYAEAALSMLAHLGLAVLPALLATAPPPRAWPWRTVVVVLATAAVVSAVAPEAVSALKPEHTWSTQELGAARPLLHGFPAPSLARVTLAYVATVIGLVAGGCLLRRALDVLGAGVRHWSPWRCLAAYGTCSLGLCFVLWFFYDRYYLPLVPVALALALAPPAEAGAPVSRPGLALAVLAMLAVLDVTGTRDMLAYARAVAAADASLRAAGVPDRLIDAGYVLNGWRLYAHPQRLAPGARPERDVPHVTSSDPQPFVVANAPLAGYVVRDTLDVPSWWAVGDRVYVLAKDGGTPAPVP